MSTKKRLLKYSDRVVFIKKFSEEAVDDIPNDLDFVYIDGNHSYEFVKKDIELYYAKMRSGGVLGGHDFNSFSLGVVKAVLEFANNYDLPIYGKGSFIDWWVVKP